MSKLSQFQGASVINRRLVWPALLAMLLAGCGKGFNDKAAQVQANQDAYLTNPAPVASASTADSVAPVTTASIASGLYSPQSVTLTCADSDSGCLQTYFTIDGTTPNKASTPYVGPIAIWSKTTIKYFSIDKAGNSEPVKTQNYLVGSLAITDIKTVATGWNHTLGIKKNGSLWAWGGNASGQLGINSTADQVNPVQVGSASNWLALSLGKSYTLALQTDGTLWAWGLNDKGQLGINSTTDSLVPVQVGTASDWAKISAGENFVLALKTDGSLWAWGFNNRGQLGINSTTDSLVPVQIGVDTDWIGIAAGYDHAAAVKNNGTLWAWGGNDAGQLGQGTTTGSTVPLQAPGSNWSAVAAGGSSQSYFYNVNGVDVLRVGGHTLALKSDGTLWGWGENIFGQLGDGTNHNMAWAGSGQHPLVGKPANDRLLQQQIGTDTDWATLSVGAGHSVALKTDGTLWAWGLNVNGQLANGNPGMNNLLPLPVGADTYLPYTLTKKPWTHIAAGGHQTFALRSDGTLWAWGWNGSGQLGDGSKISTGGGSSATTATWKLPKFAFVLSGKVYSYTLDYDIGSVSGPGTGSGQLTSTGLPGTSAGTAPIGQAIDPTGRFLYVIDSAVATVDGEQVSYIHTFAVNRDTGALTEVGDPVGVKTLYSPTSITVDPLGKFVYVTGTHSKGWKAVAVYVINPVTGELTCTGTAAKGATAITFEPLGKFAYTIRSIGVTGYSIDQRTGMLTTIIHPCGFEFCDDNEDNAEILFYGTDGKVKYDVAKYLKVDLSGQYLYIELANEIRYYHINPAAGNIYFNNLPPQPVPSASPMFISPPARSTSTGLGIESYTQFMYLLFGNNLNGFQLNQLTGAIAGVGIESAVSAINAGTEPTGKFLFVVNSNSVRSYSIDPVLGKTQINIPPQTVAADMATDARATGTLKSVVFANY